jgi:ribose 5-phosphate isomerase A
VSATPDVPTKSAEHALGLIREGDVVGLGSGRAATAFVERLGERVREGLHVRCIPTSSATAALATRLALPLTTLDDCEHIDITVDGADEVDPRLNLIKGLGGALVREKVVAAASKRLVILVGAEKEVPVLGARGTLPVEVVPFALGFCRRKLAALGLPPTPRMAGGSLYVTDNGNYILDCAIPPLPDPEVLQRTLDALPGVVGHGLFLGLAHTVVAQRGEEVLVRTRDGADE